MSRAEPITSLQDPIEELEENPYRQRLLLYQVLVVLGIVLLTAQLWRLQVVEGERYRARADNNRFREISVEAPRGVIYDRNRILLARNRPTYTVGIVPADLPPEPEPVYRRLAVVLGLQPQDIRRTVDQRKSDRFTLVPIQTNVGQDLAFVVEERHRELPGVHVVVQPIREYVDGPLTSQVLGYVGPITEEQYQRLKSDPIRRYSLNDRIGQTGVESSFERELRGSPGKRQMEVDAGGREVSVLSVDEPAPGSNLVLTIDVDLQKTLTDLMAARLDQFETASAVAIDPATGQVLALVHLPTYDNNVFSRGITEKELQALMSDPRKPLLNGAIGSTYSPGAIFKIITAAGALSEGVVKADTKVNCSGGLIVPNRLDPTLGTRFVDSGVFGEQDVVSALADSCNVYFYLAGGGDPDGKTEGLGIARLMDYARLFGLGAPSGIDLDGEADGFLGSPDWKKEAHGETWYKGDTYLAAIGQDYVLATPLQMANALAAIANGGNLYRPQLVLEIEGADERGNARSQPLVPQLIRRLPIAPDLLAAVREGLRAATQSGRTRYGTTYAGTARGVDVPGLNLAATVATVEYARSGGGATLTHGWFAGFGPVEQPRIALVVFVNRGKGAEDAAEIGKAALTRYLTRGPGSGAEARGLGSRQ